MKFNKRKANHVKLQINKIIPCPLVEQIRPNPTKIVSGMFKDIANWNKSFQNFCFRCFSSKERNGIVLFTAKQKRDCQLFYWKYVLGLID